VKGTLAQAPHFSKGLRLREVPERGTKVDLGKVGRNSWVKNVVLCMGRKFVLQLRKKSDKGAPNDKTNLPQKNTLK